MRREEHDRRLFRRAARAQLAADREAVARLADERDVQQDDVGTALIRRDQSLNRRRRFVEIPALGVERRADRRADGGVVVDDEHAGRGGRAGTARPRPHDDRVPTADECGGRYPAVK